MRPESEDWEEAALLCFHPDINTTDTRSSHFLHADVDNRRRQIYSSWPQTEYKTSTPAVGRILTGTLTGYKSRLVGSAGNTKVVLKPAHLM